MKIDVYPLQTIHMKKNFALGLVLKARFCSVLFIGRKMQLRYVTAGGVERNESNNLVKNCGILLDHSSVLTKLLIVIATFFL